jgi:hypothetical protein
MESLFAETEEELRKEEDRLSSKKRKAGKKSSGKDFSSDLQSFLQDAFEESYEAQVSRKHTLSGSSPELKKRRRKPLSGLDSLIRNTLEPSSIRIDPEATRRLVVTFKEEQLQKLKTIARKEKTYLKEIINEIVEEFIKAYESK